MGSFTIYEGESAITLFHCFLGLGEFYSFCAGIYFPQWSEFFLPDTGSCNYYPSSVLKTANYHVVLPEGENIFFFFLILNEYDLAGFSKPGTFQVMLTTTIVAEIWDVGNKRLSSRVWKQWLEIQCLMELSWLKSGTGNKKLGVWEHRFNTALKSSNECN